jgi:hypothetical protein
METSPGSQRKRLTSQHSQVFNLPKPKKTNKYKSRKVEKMQEKECMWCKNKIEKDDRYKNLVSNLEIPIGEPTFIERQVLGGECCSDCYYRHANRSNCLECNNPVFPLEARYISSYTQYFKMGILSNEEYKAKIEKEYRAIKWSREQRKKTIIVSIYDDAWANGCLCPECYHKHAGIVVQNKERLEDYQDRHPAHGSVA